MPRSAAAATMPREAHRPYRYGMTLLCFGGLLNWLGLFENYAEPVRYIGVACVVSGAMLLCFAICCWLRPGANRTTTPESAAEEGNSVHVITVTHAAASASQKPPDYDSVTDKPPSYEDAIKLSPSLLWLANEQQRQQAADVYPDEQLQDQQQEDLEAQLQEQLQQDHWQTVSQAQAVVKDEETRLPGSTAAELRLPGTSAPAEQLSSESAAISLRTTAPVAQISVERIPAADDGISDRRRQ